MFQPYEDAYVANDTAAANATEAGSQGVTGIFFTMTTVSISCNIFTLMLSGLVIYNLATAYRGARKNKEVRRKKLYLYSMLFVSFNFV